MVCKVPPISESPTTRFRGSDYLRFANRKSAIENQKFFRGCSSMAERQLPKLHTGVRFPSPAHSSPDWPEGRRGCLKQAHADNHVLAIFEQLKSGEPAHVGRCIWWPSPVVMSQPVRVGQPAMGGG